MHQKWGDSLSKYTIVVSAYSLLSVLKGNIPKIALRCSNHSTPNVALAAYLLYSITYNAKLYSKLADLGLYCLFSSLPQHN